MLNDNPRTDIEKRQRFLTALDDIKFSINHPNFGKRAIVKKPWYLPKFLIRWFDKNIGKEGVVLFIETCPIFKKLSYDLVFQDGVKIIGFGSYFEDDLEFLPLPLLTEKEKIMLGLDKFKK